MFEYVEYKVVQALIRAFMPEFMRFHEYKISHEEHFCGNTETDVEGYGSTLYQTLPETNKNNHGALYDQIFCRLN